MNLPLETIGGGIHAFFYEGGVKIAVKDLGNSVVVRKPTPEEEAADRPERIEEFAVSPDGKHYFKYTGLFMVPVLAAVYGAIPPED